MQDFWRVSSDADFEAAALELFRFQALHCAPYRSYLELVGCNIEQVQRVEHIPFLPIELFKSCEIYCGDTPAEVVFTSSGGVASRHHMRSLAEYEEAFTRSFSHFYGDPAKWGIYALLPSYLEREGSSLIYMVEGLGAKSYLYDYEVLIHDMESDPRPKILLGVSYALLDMVESGVARGALRDTIVMETGGMKGRREELTKSELHARLCEGFGVSEIASEYGMAELTSQCYSRGGGIFETPPWMRLYVRDLSDPFDVVGAGRGGINIVDLSSRWSCGFVQSQDMGRVFPNGNFELEGRITGSDTRGCNLLID